MKVVDDLLDLSCSSVAVPLTKLVAYKQLSWTSDAGEGEHLCSSLGLMLKIC